MNTRKQNLQIAPGARIVLRDLEWVVRRVDLGSDGYQQLTCDGVSALVRGQEGVFLTSREEKIDILEPARTRLVPDKSPGFRQSRLFVKSHLRQAAPSDNRIHIGPMVAMARTINRSSSLNIRRVSGNPANVLPAFAWQLGDEARGIL